MRITTAAALALAVACSQIAWPAAAQQETPDTSGIEGDLPEGSLAEDRAGAIGTDPDAVHQSGGASDPAAEAATADGEVPEGILLERREGAIGEDPDPVVQGGGGSGDDDMAQEGAAREGMAEEDEEGAADE
ncbi:MAG TPA: hypothetical protein VK943_15685 [Arenibaculum sp.]|nr:hypothetical protein [Arenibaculum sp.]